jgi:carbon monoxide dehydrogenase subunit G
VKFEGTININAPQEKVWGFLTNPDSVSQCAPGLKSVEVVEPNQKFNCVTAIEFGSLSTTFTNDVEFIEQVPPDKAVVKVHGTAPGSAVDVTSEMSLSADAEGGTDLNWTADIVVVGTIASLASRMMGGITKKMTGIFFECVKSKIET